MRYVNWANCKPEEREIEYLLEQVRHKMEALPLLDVESKQDMWMHIRALENLLLAVIAERELAELHPIQAE